MMERGFKAFRTKAKGNRYVMSCLNCQHYYQAVGDDEELCQNPNVLEYDMINTESTTYCLYWELVNAEKDRDIMSFKNGAEINGYKKKVTTTRKKGSKRDKR